MARQYVQYAVCLVLLTMGATLAWAQRSFPERPIEFTIMAGTGGGAIGTVAHEIEPHQGRNFETFFCSAMATVPEAIEAIGVLATFGHKTGLDHQISLRGKAGDLLVRLVWAVQEQQAKA